MSWSWQHMCAFFLSHFFCMDSCFKPYPKGKAKPSHSPHMQQHGANSDFKVKWAGKLIYMSGSQANVPVPLDGIYIHSHCLAACGRWFVQRWGRTWTSQRPVLWLRWGHVCHLEFTLGKPLESRGSSCGVGISTASAAPLFFLGMLVMTFLL